MSSQGSSSVRVYSGAIFTSMVGDPLSQEVSTPSISFTEYAFEVASRPTDEGVIGPTSEPASTSSRVSEEEEDEVTVSYTNLRFAIIREDSTRITTYYGLEVVMPCELERHIILRRAMLLY